MRGRFAHLAEAMYQVLRLDSAQTEFGDAGAIYKEAVRQPVEPRRRGGLASQAVPRDVSHRRLAAQYPEDRTFSDSGDPAKQRMPPGERSAQLLDIVARLRIDDKHFIAERTVQSGNVLRSRTVGSIRLRQDDQRADRFDSREGSS